MRILRLAQVQILYASARIWGDAARSELEGDGAAGIISLCHDSIRLGTPAPINCMHQIDGSGEHEMILTRATDPE